MATLTDRERELRLQFRDDFEFYAPRCLKIRTKAGGVAPLALNATQVEVHRKLQAQLASKGRVRALVLKARQVGISTYIGGRFYWKTTHRRGYLTQILTHLDDASENLFGMAKRFHDECPAVMKPETGAANAKELSFKNLDSGYKVGTAGGKAVGRSSTLQLFHGSEMAFWPNAADHFAGIMQALSSAPDTECILESTANGIGNVFHSLWTAAERGDSEYEPIFIPWFTHEEYQADVPKGWTPYGEWIEYESLHRLSRRHVYWAYQKNKDLSAVSGGSPSEINWQFRQEYPATAAEAFQTSGASFIPAESVIRARRHSILAPYGPIILGVDLARGGGDKSGIIDRQGRRLGGHVCKLVDHRDTMATVGEILDVVKRLYNLGLARIVVDATGLGGPVYDRLREIEGVGHMVMGVNFGSRAIHPNKYANRRSEMWDTMRQWLDDPMGVQVPDSDAFQMDICAPERGPGATAFNSNSQLVLESKDRIIKRLGRSPDIGDAAALTFAIDPSVPFDFDDDDTPHRSRRDMANSTTGY